MLNSEIWKIWDKQKFDIWSVIFKISCKASKTNETELQYKKPWKTHKIPQTTLIICSSKSKMKHWHKNLKSSANAGPFKLDRLFQTIPNKHTLLWSLTLGRTRGVGEPGSYEQTLVSTHPHNLPAPSMMVISFLTTQPGISWPPSWLLPSTSIYIHFHTQSFSSPHD